jgi:3-hydroxy-5-methyl-1-naphthoate 3-O-methyltransferase
MPPPLLLQQRIIYRGISTYGYGFAPPLILQEAVRLRLFDILEEGTKTSEELSIAAECSERGITFLADALVSLGYLKKKKGLYRNNRVRTGFILANQKNEVDAAIRKTSLQSAYHIFISNAIKPWLRLSEAVQTGAPAFKFDQEESGSDYYIAFAEAMFANSFRAASYLAKKRILGNYGEPKRILDLGAGSAAWSLPWALHCNQTRITAVDWEQVLSVAKKITATLDVSSQFEFVAADALEYQNTTQFDIIFIGHLFHSLGEERSRRILDRCFSALRPGGKIVIAEWLPRNDRTGPEHVMVYALAMLLLTEKGNIFSFTQIRKWLTNSGFRKVRKIQLPAPSPLILATRP